MGWADWPESGDGLGNGVGDGPIYSVGTENGGGGFSREQGSLGRGDVEQDCSTMVSTPTTCQAQNCQLNLSTVLCGETILIPILQMGKVARRG